jgi:hypothetical protein
VETGNEWSEDCLIPLRQNSAVEGTKASLRWPILNYTDNMLLLFLREG